MKWLLFLLLACKSPPAVTLSAITAPQYTILHVFQDTDGNAVRGSLTELDGRLYGLAGERGPNGSEKCSSGANWQTIEHTAHCPGSLFSLRLDGTDFRVDHAFTRLDDTTRKNFDGYHPYGTLAVGLDHRLYGVTQVGGSPPLQGTEVIHGYGVLFAFDPASGNFETLHSFFSEPRAADGEYPMGQVAITPAGDVCGTAKGGGLKGLGTAWCWSPESKFRHVDLPGESYGGLTLANGLLHGTTWSGAGTYFTVDPGTLALTVVSAFPVFTWNEHGTDNTPIQAPTAVTNGAIVASREFGGPHGAGLVVKLEATKITVLKEFDDIPLTGTPRFANATGGMVNGGLAEGTDGLLYGMAQYGGAAGTGGIWRIARDGTLFSLLYSFPDGAYPYGGLTLGSDGAFYGTTFNTSQIFRFHP
jgi:uncharacterized repeat protein (TIGR03803 family)